MSKALMIAATSSGVGKTSLCAGLALAFKNRGLRVKTFKVGPDYLDPTWLALSTGEPCSNLDIWLHGEQGVQDRFAQAMNDYDLCLIEGVMGLYDGVDGNSNYGSSAHVANLLDISVLLLANAKGCARSFIATIHGFATFFESPKFIGTIANRVGSQNHATIISKALLDFPHCGSFFGSLTNNAFPSLESRHLGLHAASSQDALTQLQKIATSIQSQIDLTALYNSIPDKQVNLHKKIAATPHYKTICRVAIAKDEAFCFYYPEWFTSLINMGVEFIPFSPLHDKSLPDHCQGVILGGGYPELFAKKLSANISMLSSIRNHAAQGKMIYAECGGLMYLSTEIQCLEATYKMLGILTAPTKMHNKLHKLGYVQITLNQDCILGNKGDLLRGHEFHYSELLDTPIGFEKVYTCSKPHHSETHYEGFSKGNILASYVHLPLDVFPNAIQALFNNTQKSSK